MEVKSASVDQIANFKLGAAARYKELNVPPAIAVQLFDRAVSKVAEDMGLCCGPESTDEETAEKTKDQALVNSKVPGNEPKTKEAAAKIDKIASDIASLVKRSRKAKPAMKSKGGCK